METRIKWGQKKNTVPSSSVVKLLKGEVLVSSPSELNEAVEVETKLLE